MLLSCDLNRRVAMKAGHALQQMLHYLWVFLKHDAVIDTTYKHVIASFINTLHPYTILSY